MHRCHTLGRYAQASDEFPIVLGTSAGMFGFDPADEQRPTVFTRDDVHAVLRVYQQLGLAEVQADKQLQVAIRRAVFAGSRALDSDRLVDWMTAAESLFCSSSGRGSRVGQGETGGGGGRAASARRRCPRRVR
jgi:hypothetical protein